ncbi:MAG: DNA replication/repair protein RecF [Eubacteriales bacterium]|nr:DNA replication/repair protein RecF [Eubacteriales bacterium]
MRLKELRLKGFRLYDEAVFRPCEGITVLCGNNAQGKTAVLEAVQLCCTGRSHRTVRDAELVNTQREAALIEAEAERPDGAHQVRMVFSKEERRRIAINGKAAARSGELMGHMLGVLFSPEDLRMVKDGPAERRRFVDMELSQLRPSYYYALQRYNRALTQRGNVLRESFGQDVRPMLDLWDEQLAEVGAQIMLARESFLQTLARHACEAYREVSDGAEELSVRYKRSVAAEGGEEQVRGALWQALLQAREADMRRGVTSKGPHRDDVELQLGAMDVRAFGSQGQQRTAALAMKLAELRVMHEISGEWPVLMLDDVMSELDPNRRRKLLEHLPGVQTIVTCTDAEDLAGAKIGLMVRVQAGTLHGGAQIERTPEEEIPDFLR